MIGAGVEWTKGASAGTVFKLSLPAEDGQNRER
jgi:hypothetical protein